MIHDTDDERSSDDSDDEEEICTDDEDRERMIDWVRSHDCAGHQIF